MKEQVARESELQVGDEVLVMCERTRRGWFRQVKRLTKTKVVLDDDSEWSLKTGRQWGTNHHTWYTAPYLRQATEERRRMVQAWRIRQKIHILANKIDATSREDMARFTEERYEDAQQVVSHLMQALELLDNPRTVEVEESR